MEAFFKTHAYLVEHTNAPVRRNLMDEINWNDRLICIKGSRGVGKTTFLLQYAREHFSINDRKCLYISMNHFYFQGNSLCNFASDFHRNGGQTLLIDQIYKYPEWASELRICYERYPGLKIIFTTSGLEDIKEEHPELSTICSIYELKGFSLREFINLRTGLSLSSYTLDDILNRHEMIAANILRQVNPADHWRPYIKHGYYPFFLEETNFSENLLKTMNIIIEIDVALTKQLEQKYINKLKKVLYILSSNGTTALNISQLASDIQTSRSAITTYFKYLTDASLINTTYRKGEASQKKPARITLHDTNLIYAIFPRFNDEEMVMDTFFLQNLYSTHAITAGDRTCTFFVDGLRFRLSNEEPHRVSNEVYYVRNNISKGHEKQIPLWLFGFLH